MEPTNQYSSPQFVSLVSGSHRQPLPWRIIVGTVILVVAVVAGWLWWQQHQQSAAVASQLPVATVAIKGSGFGPLAVRIKQGQSVLWVNEDSAEHQVAADESTLPDLQSVESLATGESYSYPFDQKGTYHFFDPLNPETFQGTVIVE
jgi:plastocyanin